MGRTLIDLHRSGELTADDDVSRPRSARLDGMDSLVAARLAHLQHTIVAGNRAMDERNRLLLTSFDAGSTQASLVEILNEVNRSVGESELTPDAIHRAVKRLREKDAKERA